LSSNSVTKEGFVQKELRYAREIALEKLDESIFLIPLRLDNCNVPRGLRFYQWVDYFGEHKDEGYSALIESLKLRHEQKLRLEEVEQARQEKEKLEREAAERTRREKVEREAAEKAVLEKAKRESAEMYKQKEAKYIGDYFKRKKRILEAAIEKRVQVDKPASLFIWIRRQATKNIIHFIPQIDESIHVDEENVKSREIKLEFPIVDGQVYPTGISIRLVAPDFILVQDQKNITVPPDDDSVICTFTVIPKKSGHLLLTIEIYKDEVLLGNRNLHTEAIANAPLLAREILVVKVPVDDIFKPRKKDLALIIALIGFVGTIIAGLLSSPLMDRLFVPIISKPTSTVTLTLISSSQIIPSETALLTPGISPSPFVFNDPHPDASDHIDAYGVPMRLVPAGEFPMGSNNGESDERPVHTVHLDSYYIDKYEVTNAFYKACADAGVCQPPQNPSSFTLHNFYGKPEYDNHPVMFMSWNMAKTYCEWRGAKLPTEAQWEKAARSTDERTYPWGEEIDQTFAKYEQDGGPSAVGSYEIGKSPYGTYDMAGNVAEWVEDWYSQTFYANSPVSNPSGPGSGVYRVHRGGTWYDVKEKVRTSERSFYMPDDVLDGFGFRCARPANETTATSTQQVTQVLSANTLAPVITDSKGVEMVLVPAGEFTIGSDIGSGVDGEKPAHQEYLDAYYIDKYEVTNAFYKTCVDVGVCNPPYEVNSYTHSTYYSEFDNYPVLYVDWKQAYSYCDWRGMGLPTEAQWEKAARGTDGRTYPWGEGIDCNKANYDGCVGDATAVGSYEDGKSPYGAYDLAGNVSEWVAGTYSAGSDRGTTHVLRGGSWFSNENLLRAFDRFWYDPNYAFYFMTGFRCAKSP
jgi:formylglycine-generating enzyme required for sulfatase activity